MQTRNGFIPSECLHPPSVWVVLQIEQNLDLWILYFGSCTAQTLSWFLCLLLFQKKISLDCKRVTREQMQTGWVYFSCLCTGVWVDGTELSLALCAEPECAWADVVPQPLLRPFHQEFCTENTQVPYLPAFARGCHLNIQHFSAWGRWEVLKKVGRCRSVASLPVCAAYFSSHRGGCDVVEYPL